MNTIPRRLPALMTILLMMFTTTITLAQTGSDAYLGNSEPFNADTDYYEEVDVSPADCWETGVKVQVDYKVRQRTTKDGLTLLNYLVKVTRLIPGVKAPEINLTHYRSEYPTYLSDGKHKNSTKVFVESGEYDEIVCVWDNEASER